MATTTAVEFATRIADIKCSLQLLHEPGSVFEIRVLGLPRKMTASGYFDDFDKAAKACWKQDTRNPSGIYTTLNPCDPAALARAVNRMVDYPPHTTSDKEILCRRWLVLDVDSHHLIGVSANADEKQAAKNLAADIEDVLHSRGFPFPLNADSGNGAYLFYRVDAPNDADATDVFKRFYAGLATLLDLSGVTASIDDSTFNASRIIRVGGTTNRRGDSTPDRPHRVAHYNEPFDECPIEVVPLDLVREVAKLAVTSTKATTAASTKTTSTTTRKTSANGRKYASKLLVPKWLEARGIEWKVKSEDAGKVVYALAQCPFDASHGWNAEVVVIQDADGKLGFKCHHNSCTGKTWRDAVEAIGRPDADHYDPPLKTGVSLVAIEGRTDVANARRLVDAYGDDIRWCDPWGKWLTWDGKRWKIDDCLGIEVLAKSVADSLWSEAVTIAKDADEKTIETVWRFVRVTNQANGIRNMVALARSDVAILPTLLDADPWLFNLDNGTLDLRSGELRPHDKADFITKLAPVPFQPGAQCPAWLAFLNDIVSAELVGYLQRLVGYCLTGRTVDHVLPFLYGIGANGKSTFINTLLALLGEDYAIKAPTDLLLAKNETHPTERADLFGKRFVACVEAEDGRRLAESLVKELTGGDKIRARRMREDFWEFSATHKIWLAANHKPIVRGTDHGIWRRIKLIPFTVVIPDDRQDKTLPDKLLAELPGILQWALEGCGAWQRGGLDEPSSVTAATRSYRTDMDIVSAFIEACCLTGPDYQCGATTLYKAFRQWCEDTGEKRRMLSQTRFGLELTERGFEAEKTRATVIRYGIGLLSVDSVDS